MGLIPDAAIGTMGAALIAATLSFLGLIISKEQKISDFRQAWIESLRIEVSTYLTNINAIRDALQITYTTQAEKVSTLSPLYNSLNTSTFNIILRLNPGEKTNQLLIITMNSFNDIIADESISSSEQFKILESEMLAQSKSILKYEWNRVKRGETTFFISKICAAIIILSIIILLLTPHVYEMASIIANSMKK